MKFGFLIYIRLLENTLKDRWKSNFWGVFIMTLIYEDKVQIYELRKL